MSEMTTPVPTGERKMFPIQSEFNRTKWERQQAIEDLPQMFIPWDMIAPHNAQSLENHQQSITRIAERGGFSRCEAIAVLEDRKWSKMTECDADTKLKRMVAEYLEAADARPTACTEQRDKSAT